MKKLAAIVGHNHKAQGAYIKAPFDDHEYGFNRDVARFMEELASEYDCIVKIIYRDQELGAYWKEIDQAYKEADDWGADLTIELHTNSAGPDATTGYTVTLCSSTPKSFEWASNAQDAMEKLFKRDGRHGGVWTRTRGERGGRSLYAGKAPACLVEPFFGSIESDCKLMNDVGVEAYARCLLGAARETFGILPRKSLKASRTVKGLGTSGAGEALRNVSDPVAKTYVDTKDTLLEVLGQEATEIGEKAQEVSHLSDYIATASTVMIIAGLVIALLARVDDFQKGKN